MDATNENNKQDELWKVEDVAAYLKMSVSAVYNLTSKKGQARTSVPIPTIRILKALRFRRSAIIAWVSELEGRV